jgi:serine/threonine-protein kinase HipA
MLIRGRDRSSQIATCVDAAGIFLLGRQEAIQIVNQQIDVIVREWDKTCDEANLSPVDRHFFWRRQFLNPYVTMNAPEGVRVL